MLSLFPSSDLSELTPDNVKDITLVHPRTGSLARFLLNESNRKLYEIQSVSRGTLSNGSFLVDPGYLVPRTDLTIHSQMDPFFILLGPLLASPESQQFVDYFDCMNALIERSEKSRDGMTCLIQCLNKSGNFKSLFLENFCESRSLMDRCLVRPDRAKITSWLVGKVDSATEFIKESDVYLVESAGNTDQFAKLVALELVRSYISDELYKDLVMGIGYDTESLFQTAEDVTENVKPHNGGSKRPASSAASAQPAAKKQKDIAIAKSCMKMTAFFKPKS